MRNIFCVVFAFILIMNIMSCHDGESDYEKKEQVENDSIESDTIKNDTIENDTLEMDTIVSTSFSSFYISGESINEHDSLTVSPFLMTDSVIHLKVPKVLDLKHIVLNFSVHNATVYKDSVELVSGEDSFDFSDFTHEVKLCVKTSLGDSKNWYINLYDLPVMIVNTPESMPITSTKYRTEGCSVSIIQENGDVIDLGTAGIKGRGASSWSQPKKPYNIKLDEKQPILGMKKSKHWILLANAYFDRTQLHNATAFEMARLTDFPWVQSGTFVELIFNQVHQGLYYLCEKIRVEKGKIEITEIDSTDLEGYNLTGGYLIESAVAIDLDKNKYFVTDYFNKTGRGFSYDLGWNCKNPDKEVIPYEQRNYIRESLNHMEMLIWNEDSLALGTYRDYFDIETAINWWLVEEATLNEEATRTKNLYIYKDRGGRFVVGPPWDFDAWTFGLYGTNHYYCTKTAFYFENLFKDPYFVNRMKEKWEKYKTVWLDSIPKFIDSQFELVHRSALRNDIMWPDFCPETQATEKTYEQNVQDMKDAFFKQIEWMDNSIKTDYYTDWWDENDWPPSHR